MQRQESALAHLRFLPLTLGHRQRKAVAHLLASASEPVLLPAGQQLNDGQVMRRQQGEERPGPWFYILEEGKWETASSIESILR